MARIVLKDLHKHFGKVRAVDGINLDVEDGEFTVFLGPSGCGKTTTLLMLAGIYKPTKGEIFFDGYLMNDVPPKDREIGMVFQSYALYPHMTLYDNIAFPLRAMKVKKDEIDRRVKEVTKNLDIGKLLDRKPHQISGGQQQRVAIARALIKRPKILLFDEPLSNLDAALRAYMRAEIKKLQHDLGITTVYVTHDQVEAMTMADRIAVFSTGKIQQYDTPENIYNKPANVFVAKFVGTPAMNIIDATVILENGSFYVVNGSIKLKTRKERAEKLEKLIGKKLKFGIRPEHIKLSPKPLDENSIKAVVYILEPLGREIIYNIKIGDVIFKVLTEERMDLHPGDQIYMNISLDNYHLFDAETGESIFFKS
ncbi:MULTISPECIES: ABC transporter ATP-binding protein [Kosmotoga]|jgi:inositol-phosphate transport system ATP-binding protein|uniref:ABC transporter related n=1 Tax=Kosmotoga olearia (strain ATCC BAA-1733 / DSM 21960 / TBF 19.5.1) TaxID=521045 RepID=C5CH26_KOSOT|nr:MULTISPECIES: ABC transporter ATP-binding protein [Kosmotoga]ACR79691.1 ABC transporter related [Kosmotoga olearia TBF 19.5.1]MDI3524572.1 inositol-phosphate transport system ATP-binding protein [Kosmotoga sp.]OAA21930.1 sugar ABC transporter ATP-binding protein [Kosmotoga sp. DU53]